jgi:hypothetical protein
MFFQIRVIASVLPLDFCLAPKQGLSLKLVGFTSQTQQQIIKLVQWRASHLQLESSLRNDLTHLGQIIVSKEI